MIRARLCSLVAGLSLFAAASARAQEVVHVVLTEPYAPVNMAAVTAFGYYMSPYSGTVNGSLERLNCVDFFHDVNIGQVWDATRVNLGAAILNPLLLQYTRDGGYAFTHGGDLGLVLKVYQQAAWLSAQQPQNPGATAASSARTVAIQTAIWAIVDNIPGHVYQTAVPGNVMGNFDPTNLDPNSTGYWIGQAQKVVDLKLVSDSYYGAFNIITDIHHLNDGSIYPADISAQEFIYMSPEPGTVALMGTGLVLLGGYARRRRNTAKDASEVNSAS